ncbi:MAG: cyclic nucleotide-binding domain-containing protein [Bdellovibrionales bacterium]|nr:cyclic nucleotide-binding domain-containing protein [Bdellovibrionales bacterium]
MSVINLIRSCPLFYELYDEEIEKIVSKCSVLKFKDGETIMKEGDNGSELYVILSGQAHTTKIVRDRPLRVGELKKGDVFGETVLINEMTRATSVIADGGGCDVLLVDHDSIFKLFREDTKVFAVLVLNLARMLTARLRASSRAITAMHEKTKKAA